jgi:hypothetical protein
MSRATFAMKRAVLSSVMASSFVCKSCLGRRRDQPSGMTFWTKRTLFFFVIHKPNILLTPFHIYIFMIIYIYLCDYIYTHNIYIYTHIGISYMFLPLNIGAHYILWGSFGCSWGYWSTLHHGTYPMSWGSQALITMKTCDISYNNCQCAPSIPGNSSSIRIGISRFGYFDPTWCSTEGSRYVRKWWKMTHTRHT